MGSNDNPTITLYTNHRCPWAHRASIAIKELGLQFEEVIIDLDTPREPWYLEINPRGLVPSIKYNGTVLTESSVVARFLADAHPSHLVPDTGNPDAALKRARINFFVDTWFDKINGFFYQIISKEDGEERDKLVKEFVEKLGKEVEPLLKDASPFFGCSGKLTLAEVLTAPFVIRLLSFSKAGYLPNALVKGWQSLPNLNNWSQAVIKQESVTYVYNEEAIIAGTLRRIPNLKKAYN